MTERILTELSVQARGISAAHTAAEMAEADKKSAAAELLAGVVEAIRPALHALSSRIVTGRVMSEAGRTEKTFDLPGLYLASIGPGGPGPKVVAHSWQGTDLFLLKDGSFVLLSYDGVSEAGGVNKWDSMPVPFTANDVVDAFALPIILDAIMRAMAAQADGNKARRTKEIEQRAARLRALVAVVRSL